MAPEEFNKLPLNIQESIRRRNQNIFIAYLSGLLPVKRVKKYIGIIPTEGLAIPIFLN